MPSSSFFRRFQELVEQFGGIKGVAVATARGVGERPFRHTAEHLAEKIRPCLPEWAKKPVVEAITGLGSAYAQLVIKNRSPLEDMFFDFSEYMRRDIFNGTHIVRVEWLPTLEAWAREHIERAAKEGGDIHEVLRQVETVIQAHQRLDTIIEQALPSDQGLRFDWSGLQERCKSLRVRDAFGEGGEKLLELLEWFLHVDPEQARQERGIGDAIHDAKTDIAHAKVRRRMMAELASFEERKRRALAKEARDREWLRRRYGDAAVTEMERKLQRDEAPPPPPPPE